MPYAVKVYNKQALQKECASSDIHSLMPMKYIDKLQKEELPLWGKLRHDNLVVAFTLYSLPSENNMYLMMQLADFGPIGDFHEESMSFSINPKITQLLKDKKQIEGKEKVVQFIFRDVAQGLYYMHEEMRMANRDIKPENILISEDHVKLADFGSCRGIYSKQPYTEYISTRWYRAPECLLTDGYYGYKMDLWGVGCVLFEVISLFPLFPGNDEVD